MGVHLVFRHHGRRRVLGNHKARADAAVSSQESGQPRKLRVDQALKPALRDVGQLGDGHARHVHGNGDGLAVEVAARNGLVVIGENERIVGDSVNLAREHVPAVAQRVAAGAVDLRHAADGIGVLHLVRIGVVRQIAALEQRQQVGGSVHLPLVAAQGVHLGVKGLFNAERRLGRQRADNVGCLAQVHGVINDHAADCRHDLRAVDEGQPFLGRQLNDGNAGLFHGLGARHDLTLVLGVAFAQHDEHHVRQRSQVAAGAQRALFRDDGVHAGVEHVEQRFKR